MPCNSSHFSSSLSACSVPRVPSGASDGLCKRWGQGIRRLISEGAAPRETVEAVGLLKCNELPRCVCVHAVDTNVF